MIQWLHLGINQASRQEAEKVAKLFQMLFGFESQVKGSSLFTCHDQIELMTAPGRGTHGHIGLISDNLESDMEHIRECGFEWDETSGAYFQDQLMSIYLKDEIAGFAVHLVRKH